jgi:hypothetical protein
VHAGDEQSARAAAETLRAAYEIGAAPGLVRPPVREVLR